MNNASSLVSPLNRLKHLVKYTGGLLMKTAVVMSATRVASVSVSPDSQANILDCHGNFSDAFAQNAMDAFVQAIPHICNESEPLLDEFEPGPLLRNFTLLKFRSGTVSSVDFATGEKKNNHFYALDNDGKEQPIPLPQDDRIFLAQIHGYQEDELCGKFMKLKCG